MKEVTFQRLTRNIRRARAATARRHAGVLWKALKDLPPRERRQKVENERKFWTWGLAERLCAESVQAAAHRADRAVELATLALRVAELAPGSEAWRSRLQGYAWAFVGNARRVHGNLPAAEKAFLHSDRLWEAGAAADPGLLDATRPLDLKASLSRAQRRLPEALALLDQALKANLSPEARGRLLVKKANTFELMGDSVRAIAELRRAESLLQCSKDTRIACLLHHCLAHNLWQLGRYSEAGESLPEARKLALQTGNQLDLIRILWVEGGVLAGLAAGVDRSLISDYEQGRITPTRKTLERLVAAAGLPYRFVEKLLPLFRSARLALEGEGLAGDPEEDDASGGLGSGLDQAFIDAVMPALAQDLMELEALVIQSSEEALPKAEDRVMVAELWATLETLPPERRRLAIEREQKYWTWSLAERLCAESETAAADRAVELAGLALRVAELSPGTEAWRWRLQGYAYAFVANARRVKGDLPGAEEAFLSSDRLWEAGAPADPGLLDGARRLELKAALRR